MGWIAVKPLGVGAAILLTVPGLAPAAAGRRPARAAAEYDLKSAPSASFAWFPAQPHTGEQVTLVSTSLDRTSPITEWAWDSSSDAAFGPFVAGGPAVIASFPTPADHVIRLRVTNAEGLSSVVEKTVRMSRPPAGVLFPFPTVGIAGALRRGGVRLTRVQVKAPADAHLRVTCSGRGCPVRTLQRVVAARAGRVALTRLRSLQRFLPAGVTLRFSVWGEGDIGAFTRFTIPHRGVPVRADSCLSPAGTNPITCPS